jgi:hypothetical protein
MHQPVRFGSAGQLRLKYWRRSITAIINNDMIFLLMLENHFEQSPPYMINRLLAYEYDNLLFPSWSQNSTQQGSRT